MHMSECYLKAKPMYSMHIRQHANAFTQANDLAWNRQTLLGW
jgi:hypothetical protein